MKALIVDFEPVVLERLRVAFERAGAEVIEAAGLAAAQEAVTRFDGDALVVADGAIIAALAAELPAGVLRLLMARPAELEAALSALAGGAFDVLPRPLDTESCALAAWRACDHLRARSEAARLEAELGDRRARLDEERAVLDEELRAAPLLERAAAERAEQVAVRLGRQVEPLPDRLDAAADLLDDATTQSAVTDAAFAARQALRLVRDLVDADRAARAPLCASPKRVAVREFAQALAGGVARIAADYDAVVELSCPETPGGCDLDAELVERALHNLLDTALRRARRGRVRLEVTTTDADVCFAVCDEAPPPPERVLATLFERRNRLEPGTIQRGAGLAFCRAAAIAHGATLAAEIPPDGGLRLSLSLPRQCAAVSPPGPASDRRVA